ncbi:hypothetical protein GCM10010452_02210 [Crossiella cryophila]
MPGTVSRQYDSTRVLLGGDGVHGPGSWQAFSRRWPEPWMLRTGGIEPAAGIAVPPGEQVLRLISLGGTPAFLVRDGDLIRVRDADGVRTVTETSEPVEVHGELPWIAVQRAPHLVEVIDLGTREVIDRMRAATPA